MTIKKNKTNTFTSHLVELRQRLIYCFVSLFIIFAISYTFAENIYSFLVQPYANAVQSDI
ncbi:MAG: twin-arginine translocase subunit TatC, partial [Pelagibacterales bacterium]|nr:twin-arginine translocase subunit TatC [Pelagibacterales bacterium]